MYKLILVDDETRIRRGLKNCIPWSELGFVVEGEASNGKEALDVTLKTRPHLIITDIKMPDMDGLEFISSVRNLGIQSLIIIISGYSDFEYARQAIHYGVTEYLLKPIEENELYDRVLNCTKKLDIMESSLANAAVQPADEATARFNNMIIKKAIEYIDKNYNRDIALSEIAEVVSVHPNYLSGLFSRTYGENFSRYLSKLRIAKAKELMKNPRFKIYEIAEMVGYSDYRWFSKIFKQYENVTPTEYKNVSG